MECQDGKDYDEIQQERPGFNYRSRKTQDASTPILATFSVFIVIPKKGIHRLPVHDISEIGMGFDLDIEGEPAQDFPISPGDTLDFRFYLNNSLYIPLTIQVVRIEEGHLKRRVGAEFSDTQSESHQAFLAFLNLLDKILDMIQIDAHPQST